MLDSIDTAPQSESLAEHKLGTELDRLAAQEARRFAALRRKAEEAQTNRAIAAALASEAGTRYTPAELAAACGAAISTALRGTRGMRLTPDDWADLRSDLMLAAIERGQRCNLDRGERPSLMPRREDLAGKSRTDGMAYLVSTARNLAADLAATGKGERDLATAPPEEPAAADLTAADLATIVGLETDRAVWAIRHAVENVPLVDLAAEAGKTAKGMERAAAKGREAIRASTDPRSIREAAQAARKRAENGLTCDCGDPTCTEVADAVILPEPPGMVTLARRPIGAPTRRHWQANPRDHAVSVLRYIDAVEASLVECPAAVAEHADRLTRATSATRRNDITRRAPLAGPEAPTPEGVGRLIGRKVRAAALESMRRAPVALEACYPARRPTESGTVDTTGASYSVPAWPRRKVNAKRDARTGQRTASPMARKPRYSKAHGPMTEAVTWELSALRQVDLAQTRAAWQAMREEAKRAGKLTLIETDVSA